MKLLHSKQLRQHTEGVLPKQELGYTVAMTGFIEASQKTEFWFTLSQHLVPRKTIN